MRPDRLKALAAELAEHIARDESLATAITARLTAHAQCRPGELCCTDDFFCDNPFSCRPAFGCTKNFWGIAHKVEG